MLTNFHIYDLQWNFSEIPVREIPVPTEITVEFQWNFTGGWLVTEISVKFQWN